MMFYQYFRILISFLFFILLNTFTAEAQVWYDGPVSVHETHPFTIACNNSLFANIKWRKSEPIFLESENFVYVYENRKFSNMTIKYALPFHTGNYKCSYELDDYGHNLTVILGYKLTPIYEAPACPDKSGATFSLQQEGNLQPPDNTLKCVVTKPYEKFKMQCKPEPSLSSNLTVAWYKASKDNKDFGTLIQTGDTLEFNAILPNDTAVYHCRVVSKGQEDNKNSPFLTAQLIEVQVLPWVKTASKEISVIEENPINLTCIVFSNVPTTVEWKVTNAEGTKNYTANSGRVTLSKLNDTTNSILSIKSANISIDRGTYVCFAKSDVGYSPSNMTFSVRIKSKYAALWPFLGICAEVIILCTIILIYEKKRDKTELEESDTDQGPETKSSPDHGQDSVRYRK